MTCINSTKTGSPSVSSIFHTSNMKSALLQALASKQVATMIKKNQHICIVRVFSLYLKLS